MSQLDSLEAAVAQSTEVQASAVVLIQGIADQLRDAQSDPVKIAQLESQLRSSAESLSAAITANTPAAPSEA